MEAVVKPFARNVRQAGKSVLFHHAQVGEHSGIEAVRIKRHPSGGRRGPVDLQGGRRDIRSDRFNALQIEQIAQQCGGGRFSIRFAAVVARAAARHCERRDAQFLQGDLAQVLHSQRVVWGGQNLGDLLPVKLFHRLLSGARVGDAALEQVFRIIAAVGGADCFGCFGQQCEIAAFASKGDDIHAAERAEQAHSAGGEPFGRSHRVGQGQFEHKVRAAGDRRIGADRFGRARRTPALNKVAAEYGYNMRRAGRAGRFDLIGVPIVEGIVFSDNARSHHFFHTIGPFHSVEQ